MSFSDRFSLLSSQILEANRLNNIAVSDDTVVRQVVNKYKKSRAKSFLDRALISSNSLDASRLQSLMSFPLLSNPEHKFRDNKKKKRHIIYDNDNNTASINKRNYYFNKKLERDY